MDGPPPDKLDEYPVLRPAIPAHYLSRVILFHVVALSIASFHLFLENASEEPYLAFIPRQAVSQIGGTVTVVVLWIYLIGAVVFGVATRRIGARWLLATAVAVAGIALVLLSQSAYLADLFKFHAVKPPY